MTSVGQFGIYGPPLCRKRKMKVTGWSAQMHTALVGAPGHDGLRFALVFSRIGRRQQALPSSRWCSGSHLVACTCCTDENPCNHEYLQQRNFFRHILE